MSKLTEENIVDRVTRIFGSDPEFCRVALAKTGKEFSRQSIHQWRSKGYIPARYALLIEEVTVGKVKAIEVLEAAAINAR